jgi:hypothetical protein
MIMLKGVGVDPLPIYKREPAARDGAYLYVPDRDALAPDSEMSWKKQPISRPICFLRIDHRWIAWARAIVSRHDYSKALKRENVSDKEGN